MQGEPVWNRLWYRLIGTYGDGILVPVAFGEVREKRGIVGDFVESCPCPIFPKKEKLEMSSKSSPSNQPPKSIRTIRPLTEFDTKGAPFVSLVDTAKFTGLGEAILRKGCKIAKFGNACATTVRSTR